MAYNPISAYELPADDPFFDSTPRNLSAKSEASQSYNLYKTHGSDYAKGYVLNTAADKDRPEAHQEYVGQLPQTAGRLYSSQETKPAISDNYFSQRLGNAQHNLSPTAAQQLKSNPVNSPNPRVQSSTSQPPSVKHLTCWYWANKGCKLADSVCLYAHFDTGRLADPPVQIQRGRRAVAGKNATNPRPVYKDWKGHLPAHSAVLDSQIQNQIKHIYAKAAQHSKPTPVKAEQSEIANMVKEEGFGSAERLVNFNRPHPDDRPSPPPADSHRNLSIDFEAPGHPFNQNFSHYPHQAGGNFMASSPSAQYIGGSTHYGMDNHYGMGGNYGGMSGHYDMGSNLTNYGPGPRQFGGNSPNHPNTFASPGQSDGPTQEMRKQMKVKDKVITELAEIVEMLEINYGISIDDQTDTLQKFMNIARSMEEDAKKAREEGKAISSSRTTGRAIHLPTASTSAPSYNHPAVNHQHILTAMEGSLNLVNMEKMVLAKSKARKHAISEDLESVQAEKLLPGGWIER